MHHYYYVMIYDIQLLQLGSTAPIYLYDRNRSSIDSKERRMQGERNDPAEQLPYGYATSCRLKRKATTITIKTITTTTTTRTFVSTWKELIISREKRERILRWNTSCRMKSDDDDFLFD